MKETKRQKILGQIRNLRKLDVIINNKLIDNNEASRDDSLDSWVSQSICGSKGCVLGDYMINNHLTPSLINEAEIVLFDNKIVIGAKGPFDDACQDLDINDEFGFNYADSGLKNGEFSVFTTSEGPSYHERLKIVRKRIKKLRRKLQR